jgi:hypothetical protein
MRLKAYEFMIYKKRSCVSVSATVITKGPHVSKRLVDDVTKKYKSGTMSRSEFD